MPNTKSAIRRVRRVKKQSQVNKVRKSKYKAAIKKMEMYVKNGEKEKAKNDDRADIQERNLDRYTSRQEKTIRGVIEKLRAKGNTGMIPASEGRLRGVEERHKLQKLTIDSRRSVKSKTEDICLAIVLVE